MEFPIDPSMLNKPLSELELPKDQRTNEGIQVQDADALAPAQTPEAPVAPLTSDEDGKVPYRRFKKFHDAAQEAQREAEFWREQALKGSRPEPERQQYRIPDSSEYAEPVYQGTDWERFKALFAGADETAVKDAYRLESQRLAAVEERAMNRAVQAFEQRATEEQQALRANRSFLDEWTETAADLIGRDLSQDEEVALLDIMDEYSPKDRNGRIEAPIPVESALRIFEMQAARDRAPRREARNAIASISGASAGGDTSVAQTQTDVNSKFVPQLGWRANFQRMTGRSPDKV